MLKYVANVVRVKIGVHPASLRPLSISSMSGRACGFALSVKLFKCPNARHNRRKHSHTMSCNLATALGAALAILHQRDSGPRKMFHVGAPVLS